MKKQRKFKTILEETLMNSFTNYHSPLLERLRRRIRWDARISNRDVQLKNAEGTIVVTGFLDAKYRKDALMSSIQTTHGVSGVIDQVQVVPDYFRTDTELKALIEKSMEHMYLNSGEWFNVQVSSGVVKFAGQVFRPELKAMASRVSWELSGVRDCLNLIEIKDPEEWALSFRGPELVPPELAPSTKVSMAQGLETYKQHGLEETA